MEYRKLKLAPVTRRDKKLKSPRMTVRGYTGTFNTLGKDLVGQVCKAWGLPTKYPAALALHTPVDAGPYELCAVPLQVATEEDVPIIVSEDSKYVKADLLTYMNSINLHLGERTRWEIYLEVRPGVDGKPCLFLDTKTDLEEIRRQQHAQV